MTERVYFGDGWAAFCILSGNKESFICLFNQHVLIACYVPVTEETNMSKTLSPSRSSAWGRLPPLRALRSMPLLLSWWLEQYRMQWQVPIATHFPGMGFCAQGDFSGHSPEPGLRAPHCPLHPAYWPLTAWSLQRVAESACSVAPSIAPRARGLLQDTGSCTPIQEPQIQKK